MSGQTLGYLSQTCEAWITRKIKENSDIFEMRLFEDYAELEVVPATRVTLGVSLRVFPLGLCKNVSAVHRKVGVSSVVSLTLHNTNSAQFTNCSYRNDTGQVNSNC